MRRSVRLLIVGLAALGVCALAGGARRSAQQSPRRTRQGAPARRIPSREEWDEVDEASYESFPASDPPSYSRRNL
jgi:hypothetical protein